jgi:hypothetical protein
MGVLLVVMEWTGAITGDHVGLFLECFSKEKNLWASEAVFLVACDPSMNEL